MIGGRGDSQCLRAAGLLAGILCILVISVSGCGSGAGSTEGTAAEDSAAVKRIYLGVDCLQANSVSCDRVGVAVELREPASRMSVIIAGRRVPLHPGGCLQADGGRNFCGSLDPAGLGGDGTLAVASEGGRWLGSPAVRVPVRISVQPSVGQAYEVTRTVRLSPGFG